MFNTWLYALTSVTIVSLLSLVGVVAMAFNRKTLDTMVFYLVALATGTMLGNALVHLLPEAFAESTNIWLTGALVGVGGLASWLLHRRLNLSCHHAGECHARHHCACAEERARRGHSHPHIHPTGYMALVSHGMDNFIDGILIGVAYLISPEVGVLTTIAIILHEVPMEFGGFGVLVDSGFSKKRALLVNGLSGGVSVIATVLTLVIGSHVENLVAYLAPFAGGTILYITCVALIPKMLENPNRKRLALQVLVAALGFGLMVAVRFFE
jgi:zinc and cadmium transporter